MREGRKALQMTQSIPEIRLMIEMLIFWPNTSFEGGVLARARVDVCGCMCV